jgi:hypothetical protein
MLNNGFFIKDFYIEVNSGQGRRVDLHGGRNDPSHECSLLPGLLIRRIKNALTKPLWDYGISICNTEVIEDVRVARFRNRKRIPTKAETVPDSPDEEVRGQRMQRTSAGLPSVE